MGTGEEIAEPDDVDELADLIALIARPGLVNNHHLV
jgi:hypothetical protein